MQYSIVNLSEIKQNSDLRMDAEYWKPDLINMDKYIEHILSYKISDMAQIITNGATPLRHDLTLGDVKFITPEFMSEFFINKVNKFILLKHHETELRRTQLQKGDILYCIKGRIGSVVPILKNMDNFNINQDVAKIRLKDNFNSTYVATFLNTKYGIIQSKRYQTGQINPFLGLNNLQKISIPIFSQSFQSEIADLVNSSYTLRQSADTLYKEAEDILLEELGLKNYQPQNKKCFVKMLSDTKNAGRIDAEYFQPKYEDIIEKIKTYGGGWDVLENITTIKKCIEPGSSEYKESGIPFVRVSNLEKVGINTNNQQFVSKTFYENNLEHQPNKNDILLSKDGSLGIAYCLNEEPKKMICSGGIVRLIDSKIEPLCLTLLLNSIACQMQIEQTSGGALIAHWLINDIKNLIIPKIFPSIQSTISSKIQSSFSAREKSKQLLEVAKMAVEIAIEEGENAGLGYIEKNVDVK